jgi:DHA2 family multidrug resistance protein
MSGYTLQIGPWSAAWPGMLQGFGMGLMMVPLSAVALSSLPKTMVAEAAGLFSLVRTFGSSVGIAVAETIAARHAQMAWNQLGGHINPFNPTVGDTLRPLGLAPDSAMGGAVLGLQLAQAAQMQAILDVFALVALVFVLMLPLLFMLDGRIANTNTPVAVE